MKNYKSPFDPKKLVKSLISWFTFSFFTQNNLVVCDFTLKCKDSLQNTRIFHKYQKIILKNCM